MGTTISLPESLLELAQKQASEQGKTLNEFVEVAVWSEVMKPARPREPFKLLTVGGGLVDPTINLDRTSELICRDDEEQYGHH
jgi:hypothetical protein